MGGGTVCEDLVSSAMDERAYRRDGFCEGGRVSSQVVWGGGGGVSSQQVVWGGGGRGVSSQDREDGPVEEEGG